jgi:hypothetical protein
VPLQEHQTAWWRSLTGVLIGSPAHEPRSFARESLRTVSAGSDKHLSHLCILQWFCVTSVD